jgi:hypothetical protein
MTKLTFDVDFTKDPEQILREIQERAKIEVAKRESKIKTVAFLSKLHEKVNQEIGTDYKSVNELIRALSQFANPKLSEKIGSTSASGRRVTISMNRELFDQIKTKLSEPNPNKAAIARETGASVVQVRKVASGGYDQKFSSDSTSRPSSISSTPDPITPTPIQEDDANENLPPLTPPAPSPALDLPPVPSATGDDSSSSDASPELPPIAPPSMGGEVAEEPPSIDPPLIPEETANETLDPPIPSPAIDLPPVPSATGDDSSSSDASPELPPIAPPSMSDEVAEEPPSIDPPSIPEETADETLDPPIPPIPSPALDLPPVPSATGEDSPSLDSSEELPPIAPPSMGEELTEEPTPIAPPPPPSLDLPPEPSVPEPVPPSSSVSEPAPEEQVNELPPIAPPSLGEELAQEPTPVAPPSPSLDLPPEPPVPSPPSEPNSPEAPSAPPKPSGTPGKPSLSLKTKGKGTGLGGKPGKPTLSLKSGKKKPGGLKITRPPMRPPSA